MSTFGEIVEPTSRTAWEDWDEILPNSTVAELKWQRNVDAQGVIDTLYLFEGKYLSDCVKRQTHYKLYLINSVQEVNLHLYKVQQADVLICIVKDYNLVLSSEVVELLKPYLAITKDVIAIQTKPLSEFNTSVLRQDSVIRTITTSVAHTKPFGIEFHKLEQPNIISGIGAGVISLREHLKQPGTAVVCYIEYLEEYQVEAMQKLLEKLNITPTIKSRPNTVLNSNLYI